MEAILGKITNVATVASHSDARQATRLDVSFSPVCVLPSRSDVPEWLAGQTLTIRREVTDPREVGDVGDSIVVTPEESAVWLGPLRVEPSIALGQVPQTVRLKLLWWSDENPGDVVAANGRRRMFSFGAADQDGQFAVDVPTGVFFDHQPSLPADLVATFGKLAVGCAILPTDGCCHRRLWTHRGERQLVRSRWYDVRISAERAGGGICALREIGRNVDHFQSDGALIGEVFTYGGHVDLARLGWPEKMHDTAMTCVAARRDAEACRLHLEGDIDKDRAHTALTTTVFDELPLVLMQRDVVLKKPAKKDDDAGGHKASVPVDDVVMLTLGFRAAYRVEPDSQCASRVLSVDAGRLAVVRLCETHDSLHGGWRPSDGWVLIEHPQRRQCAMYLFDHDNPPELRCWLGDRVMTVEPQWPAQPVRPDQGAGFTLALTAGEVCGASVGGAWVACRRPLTGGGVACAIVGRFVEPLARRTAAFHLGANEVSAELERTMLPGVGTVYVASAVVAEGRMTDTFTATAGDVSARSDL